jgi:hypothetical protein
MLNFNREILSAQPINQLVNRLIEAAEPPSENFRQYLGASTIGSEYLDKTQYDWFCNPQVPARSRIFGCADYQAYLDVTNPALFSVVNADTCERLHFLVPFDVQLAQMMSDRAVIVSKRRAQAAYC